MLLPGFSEGYIAPRARLIMALGLSLAIIPTIKDIMPAMPASAIGFSLLIAKEIFIAGADKAFYPATVKVDGDKIIVSSKQVRVPVAVRYQFSNAGIGNLFSKGGLPVAPFRTDDWEVNTSKIN